MAAKAAKQEKGTKVATPAPEVGTSVSTRLSGPLVLVQDQIPEHLRGMEGARGSENVGVEDLVIPRLEVLQALSPACDADSPEYNKSCKPGDLMNSVTNRLYGKEVFVVPVHFTKQFLVWKDRKRGGGFFGAYPTLEEAKDRAEQEGGAKQGVEAIDTPTHVCLIVDRESGSVDEIIMSMPRTKAKISRQWNSMVKMAGGDRFARVYRVTTQKEKNAKGDFWNFAIAQSGFPVKALYQHAEKLYNQIKGGQRKVVMDTKDFQPGSDEETDM